MLTPGEVDDFFAVVRSLVDQGKSIIFITHKLREVLAVADRITVLRDGRVAGTADPTTATQQSLANLMVGRDVVFQVEKGAAAPGDVVLRVDDLRVEDDRGVQTVNGFSVEVRGGEIFGVAGVEGNGQRELVEAITGMRRKRRRTRRDPRPRRHQDDAAPDHRARRRPHPRGPRASTASSGRTRSPTTSCSTATTRRRSPGAASATRRPIDDEADRLVAPVRRAHARHRRRRRHAVGRQPAEGDRRPRADRATSRCSFVAQPTRGLDVGLDRVHPQADHRPARPGRRACCWCRPSSTRSSSLSDRDRRAVPGPTRRHVRRRGRDAGAARLPDGDRRHPRLRRSSSDERAGQRRVTRRRADGSSSCGTSSPCSSRCTPSCCRSSSAASSSPSSASTRSRPTGRCCAACSALPSGSPDRSPDRSRSSARPWRSPSPSAPGCSTSAPRVSCSSAGSPPRGSARGRSCTTLPGILAVPIIIARRLRRRRRSGAGSPASCGPAPAPTR